MFDASSDPKSLRMRTTHLKWLIGLAGLVFLVFVTGLVYYYGSAYKIFYYDEIEEKYRQLARDNVRIMQIEKQYRQVKQENEKIRRVFGFLGRSADSSRVLSPGVPASDVGSEVIWSESQPAGIKYSDESRFATADYFTYSKVVPSIMPVNSRFVARGYEQIPTEEMLSKSAHLGYDIVAEAGSPVKAASDGWVILADWMDDSGNTVMIYHGFGYFSVYKHNQHLLCKEGRFVRGGEIIATVGRTGYQTSGNHLHFEIWKDGIPQDPGDYIPGLRDALEAGNPLPN